MRLLSRSLPAFLSALLPILSAATTYYVSPTGSNSNSGTSQSSAWQTIDRVNQVIYALQPGDQIRFQRGGVYRGELNIGSSGTSSQPIVVGAYGSGADPVISGSVPVTGWTNHQGNIWKASISQAVEYVFVNGQRMTLARYPNSGWLRNDNGSGTTLHDAALTQPNGYWTGATAVIRSTNWSYDAPVITGFSGGTLSFSNIWYNLGGYDWGYFLCDKLSELDAPGEWYHDPNTGMLYLWTTDGGSPSSKLVEAAVKDRGVICIWQEQWITIEGISFRHQKMAAVRNDGASHVTVTGCTFQDCFQGINSYGDHSTYAGNTFNGTYASAMHLIDDNTTVSDNILTNIAMVPGLGESNWGYFGIRLNGTGNIIRSNRLTTIGYIGIAAGSDCLVEKNVVDDATALLNDGGGISFDGCNGMIVRDNIVLNVQGDLESSAPDLPSYEPIAHGIYFGNTVIQNTLVQHNTVAHCTGSGIHVDHTMVSSGNQIKDNVLFNNKTQLTISDYSNNNGPGATAPYYVASFNGVYSGNLLYCLTKDQLCMKQYNVYSASPVDFGTFSNNRYYNPYNELSIAVHNTYSGAAKTYALERWQAERSEDAGSTRSPQHLLPHAVNSVLQTNMVVNGTFNSNVTGWTGWPTNATSTWQNGPLDGGTLRANLPNNNVYPDYALRNPDAFGMTNGQWYSMKFSLQSPSGTYGQVRVGIKGVTQLSNQGMIAERTWPWDGTRRDCEFIFQCGLTDNAYVQFVNNYLEPTYYLDNVSVERVTVTPIDPTTKHVCLTNTQATAQNMSLPAGCWAEVGGSNTSGSVTVQPYRSRVFYKVSSTACGGGTGSGAVGVKVFLGGALNWGTGIMRDDLRSQSLIPNAEPFTAMGFTLENTGATISGAVSSATGNQAMVDWVMLELRNADAGYTTAARRAAIVRRDGTVVATDGSALISFNVATQGRHLVLRHRNHLGVMTASPLSADGLTIDLTAPGTVLYGTNAQQGDATRRALWPGNVAFDTAVRYTGSSNDRDPILSVIGGTVPTGVIQGYRTEDVNMDGWTIYTGPGNDRDLVLSVIGGSVPTAVKTEQLP